MNMIITDTPTNILENSQTILTKSRDKDSLIPSCDFKQKRKGIHDKTDILRRGSVWTAEPSDVPMSQ